MTPTEKAILDLIKAADRAGLDAIAEIPDDRPPNSVDLRVMRAGRVVAAIRARIEGSEWRYEIPARPGGQHLHGVRTRYLGPVSRPLTAEDLAVLDHWLARIPGTGRLPAPRPPRRARDTPKWMRPPLRTS